MPSIAENVEIPEILSHSTPFEVKMRMLPCPLFHSGVSRDDMIKVYLKNDEDRLVSAMVMKPRTMKEEHLLMSITYYQQALPNLTYASARDAQEAQAVNTKLKQGPKKVSRRPVQYKPVPEQIEATQVSVSGRGGSQPGIGLAKQVKRNSVAPEPTQSETRLHESPSVIRLRELSREGERLADEARRMLQELDDYEDENSHSFLPGKHRVKTKKSNTQPAPVAPPRQSSLALVDAPPQSSLPPVQTQYKQQMKSSTNSDSSQKIDICQILEYIVYHKSDNNLHGLEMLLSKAMHHDRFFYEEMYSEEDVSDFHDQREILKHEINLLQMKIAKESKILKKQRKAMLDQWSKEDEEKRARKEASRKNNVFKRIYYCVNKKKLEKKLAVEYKLMELAAFEREEQLEQLDPERFLEKDFAKLDDLINKEKQMGARIVTALLSFSLKRFTNVVASSTLKRQQSSSFELWQGDD